MGGELQFYLWDYKGYLSPLMFSKCFIMLTADWSWRGHVLHFMNKTLQRREGGKGEREPESLVSAEVKKKQKNNRNLILYFFKAGSVPLFPLEMYCSWAVKHLKHLLMLLEDLQEPLLWPRFFKSYNVLCRRLLTLSVCGWLTEGF